jgi:hypothetical protein
MGAPITGNARRFVSSSGRLKSLSNQVKLFFVQQKYHE